MQSAIARGRRLGIEREHNLTRSRSEPGIIHATTQYTHHRNTLLSNYDAGCPSPTLRKKKGSHDLRDDFHNDASTSMAIAHLNLSCRRGTSHLQVVVGQYVGGTTKSGSPGGSTGAGGKSASK